MALSPAQKDGLTCIFCDRSDQPQQPVGHSETGSQVFACVEHVVMVQPILAEMKHPA